MLGKGAGTAHCVRFGGDPQLGEEVVLCRSWRGLGVDIVLGGCAGAAHSVWSSERGWCGSWRELGVDIGGCAGSAHRVRSRERGSCGSWRELGVDVVLGGCAGAAHWV